MLNTSDWPIKTFDVVDLVLDVANVRLRDVQPYEEDILAYMFESEDALSLAMDITSEGLFDNDLPIVTTEDDSVIVLEGNRRISALKGIANPTSIPKYKRQLEQIRKSLSVDELALLETVRAIVAPDREIAQPILARVHTRNPKKAWPLDQQAQFYHAQLAKGVSVADLQRKYPAVASKIPRFIRMAEMYELVRSAKLGNKALEQFVLTKQFKMSTLERLYSSDEFLEILGAKFRADGRVSRTKKKEDSDRVLAQVVADIRAGAINTRTLGTKAGKPFVSYLDSLKSSTGRKSTKKAQPKPSTQKKGSATRTRLGRELDYQLPSAGLRRRLVEFQRLDYLSYPNATMDFIRTILECSLKEYFDSIGDPVKPGRNGYAGLAEALAHAQKHFEGDKKLRTIVTRLKAKPTDEKEFHSSAAALNAVNHEPSVFFNHQNVLETWESAEPLISVLLRGADSSDGGSDD